MNAFLEGKNQATQLPNEDDVELQTPQDIQEMPKRKHRWTNTHSFYAIMDGLAFDTSHLPLNEKFLPGGRDRVTLSPMAVLITAEHDPSLLPEL